jgi:hypothetical protein
MQHCTITHNSTTHNTTTDPEVVQRGQQHVTRQRQERTCAVLVLELFIFEQGVTRGHCVQVVLRKSLFPLLMSLLTWYLVNVFSQGLGLLGVGFGFGRRV